MEQWSKTEIRIRNLVKQLIEPTTARTLQIKEQVQLLRLDLAHESERIDTLEISNEKHDRKLQVLDILSQRLVEFSAQQKTFDIRLQRDKQRLKSIISQQGVILSGATDKITVQEHQCDDMRTELNEQGFQIQKMKTIVEEKISDFRNRQKDEKNNVRKIIEDLETKLKQSEFMVQQLGKTMQRIQLVSKKAQVYSETNKQEVKDYKKNMKAFMDQNDAKIEAFKNDTAKRINSVKEEFAKMKRRINFELLTQAHLETFDFLHEVTLDRKLLRKLAELELNKIQSWNKLVFNKNLEQKISLVKNRAQQILDLANKRNNSKLQKQPTLRSQDSKTSKKSKIQKSVTSKTQKPPVPPPIKKVETPKPVNLSNSPSKTPKQKHSKTPSVSQNKPSSNLSQKREKPSQKTEQQISQPQKPLLQITPPVTNELETILDLDPMQTENSYSSVSLPSDHSSVQEFQGETFEDVLYHLKMLSQRFGEFQKASTKQHLTLKRDTTMHTSKVDQKATSLLRKVKSLISTHQNTLKSHMGLITNTAASLQSLTSQFGQFYHKTNQEFQTANCLIEKTLQDYENTTNQRKRDLSDINSEFKTANDKIYHLQVIEDSLREKVKKLTSVQDHILELFRMQVALQFQDEQDRDSIALMGYQQHLSDSRSLNKRVISFDRKCISCNSQAAISLRAFKMACLNYTPSLVVYNTGTYSRKQLIQAQSEVLSSIGSTMQKISLPVPKAKQGRTAIMTRRFSTNSSPKELLSTDEFPRLTSRRPLTSHTSNLLI